MGYKNYYDQINIWINPNLTTYSNFKIMAELSSYFFSYLYLLACV